MSTAPRADGRQADQLRKITFEANIAPHASGSVLVSFGATRVICAATIEPKVPSWMRQQGVPGGWLTACLAASRPRCSHSLPKARP